MCVNLLQYFLTVNPALKFDVIVCPFGGLFVVFASVVVGVRDFSIWKLDKWTSNNNLFFEYSS